MQSLKLTCASLIVLAAAATEESQDAEESQWSPFDAAERNDSPVPALAEDDTLDYLFGKALNNAPEEWQSATDWSTDLLSALEQGIPQWPVAVDEYDWSSELKEASESQQLERGQEGSMPEAAVLVFEGPSLDTSMFGDKQPKSLFEQAVQGSGIAEDLKEYILRFVPDDLSAQLSRQEVPQLVAMLERASYELSRGVEDLRQARIMSQVKLIIFGTVRYYHEMSLGECSLWNEADRICRYVGGLATYYLWLQLCGSLQYPPLINAVCSRWPMHLFHGVHLYESVPEVVPDVSPLFKTRS